jgi:hypothetical protein
MGKAYALALGVGGVRHGRQRDVGHELRDFFAGSTLFVTPGVDKLPADAGQGVVSDRLVDQGKQLPTVGLERCTIGRENVARDGKFHHGAARRGVLALEVEAPGFFEDFRSIDGSEAIPSLDELTNVHHRRRCSARTAACRGRWAGASARGIVDKMSTVRPMSRTYPAILSTMVASSSLTGLQTRAKSSGMAQTWASA